MWFWWVEYNADLNKHHKIPKISLGAYIFQRPFLRGLFLEGLIYGGKFVFQKLSARLILGGKFVSQNRLGYSLCLEGNLCQ